MSVKFYREAKCSILVDVEADAVVVVVEVEADCVVVVVDVEAD